ncbi:SDR family NAD(P)-dependent oxidoreductase [Phaeovulum vinaykumarii]|uniref:Short-chain dehydrogenase n=1 Tax=Phaeovulum vinaykumarii TaxID=407234 RepID=A0A1N7M3R2_9RHOB|nr:SDR family oxidoreductase [Phaeovulum vinaykumarii]SIS80766.1 Short-chain dehydrogenase [Phaeovulum vinaykumarii]SOC08968.1 short-subunit dehydrogenase [Phaeovulum vinaykumarii]
MSTEQIPPASTPADAAAPAHDPSAGKPIALVTGASRGLGFAMAEALAREGWHVLAVARTQGGLEGLDDRIQAAGGSATLAPMDICEQGAMEHLVNATGTRWGGIGAWVHAAIHAAPLTPTGHFDPEDLETSTKTNVIATAKLIALIEPLLRAREGKAMFFDDPRAGQPFFSLYGATKAGQIAYAQSWAAESAKIGPRVEIVTPPPMPTAVRARFFPGEDRAPLTDPHAVARDLVAAHFALG